MTEWMIYGANGYTGRLIARLAKQRGLTPIIAGRNAPALKKMATNLGFEHRIFDLDDKPRLLRNLDGVSAVLHCAGPFSATSRPMLEACLRTRVHYLDITGEIAVFEAIHGSEKQRIAEAGIYAVPGVGFDVVPTDCLAAKLKERLPEATSLKLAIKAGGPSRISPGTTKTIVEAFGDGGRVRRAGRLIKVPAAYQTAHIDIGGQSSLMVTVPWGDLATAWYTTGIPDIDVYMSASLLQVGLLRASRWAHWVAKTNTVQSFLKQQIEKKVRGPSAAERSEGKTYVWGQVADADGHVETMELITPEAYTFTADSAVRAVQKVLELDLAPGPYTPSQAFGSGFVDTLDGVKLAER